MNQDAPPPQPDPAQPAGGVNPLDGSASLKLPLPAPAEPVPEPDQPPHVDPWAHRRGEPRIIAFFWTLYVLLAVAGSVTWVARFATVTPDSYAPGARIMIIVLAVGATMLWPMVRLSQAVPDGSSTQGGAVSSVAVDLVVVLVPLHMTIWPMLPLANWPLNIVSAVAACLSGWVLLVGGVLALTQAVLASKVDRTPEHQGILRSLAMVLVVVLVLAGPVAMLLGPPGGQKPWLGMLSPLTAIADITGRGLIGPQNAVTAVQWRLIGLAWICAASVWMLALVRAAFVKPSKQA